MTAILGSDVFPGLDIKNPLDSADEDEIPKRFGNRWYESQGENEEENKVDEEVKKDEI